MKIAVFMGGTSLEREISLLTGKEFLESLKRQGYDAYGVDVTEENIITAFTDNEYDLAYLAFHGGSGENGEIQALLELLGKKYTGSGVTASAVAMDKNLTKIIAEDVGILLPKSYANKFEITSYPVIIKPVNEGSSFGIDICNNIEEVEAALEKRDNKPILIEEYIVGEELTVAVLNGEGLGVLRIIPNKSKWFDFEAKYSPVNGAIHEFPAKISKKIYNEALENSVKIHNALKMRGISRSDFILSEDKIYFLEVNSCPGMTKQSLVPDIATLKGYTFDDLIRIMVETFI